MHLLYFAYGSNMATHRLRERVPLARTIFTARLRGHVLRFHKQGRDDSAKCDILATNKKRDAVYGVLYEIPALSKPQLDVWEGLGEGYEEKQVSIVEQSGRATLNAFTYFATNLDPKIRPYQWYKEHVLRGAVEHELPKDYIAAIEAVECINDPNPKRHMHELSIYPEALNAPLQKRAGSEDASPILW